MKKHELSELVMSLFLEGTAFYENNEFKQAEKKLKEALMLLPESEEVLYNLALVYSEQKKIAKARELICEINNIDCSDLNNLLDQYENDLSPVNKFCRQCQNFDTENGVCKTLHFNVRDYPYQFIKKCEGELFVPYEEMESEILDEVVEFVRPLEKMDEYTEILSTFNLGDISVLKSLLDPTDIEYILENEHFHNVSPMIHPVRLPVKKEQVETVNDLLKDLELNFFFIKSP